MKKSISAICDLILKNNSAVENKVCPITSSFFYEKESTIGSVVLVERLTESQKC